VFVIQKSWWATTCTEALNTNYMYCTGWAVSPCTPTFVGGGGY
jgi:hypothetical protein